MIKAVMYWDRLRLEVNGHAGAGVIGQDIVCAGASMLVSALAGVLEEAEARGRCECKAKQGEGSSLIWANPTMGSMVEIKSYFKMAVKGMRMLAEEYPGNVVMQEVR